MTHDYAPRDFIETPEGLIFAVMANDIEDERVVSFLRYVRDGATLRKLDTESANKLLQSRHQAFLFNSRNHAASVHAVPLSRISHHYVPQHRAAQLLRQPAFHDRIEKAAASILRKLVSFGVSPHYLGITGSLLIAAQNERSDVDLVITDRDHFHLARDMIRRDQHAPQRKPLSIEFWRNAYERRSCSLSFDQYVWHERRKFNKTTMDGVKTDISLGLRQPPTRFKPFEKISQIELTATILDDDKAFDHPAVWSIDSEHASQLICWTPTFAGQAQRGEKVRVRGWLEHSSSGTRQVVVGSSREAHGESIVVIEETSLQ